MRIRSVLTSVLVGAGVLLLGAPAVLADQAPTASPAPPRTTVAPSMLPPTASPARTTVKPPTAPPRPRAAAVKPKGPVDAGGGGTAER